MNFHPAFFFVPAALSGALAALVLFRESKSLAHRFFVLGLGLLCVECLFSGYSAVSYSASNAALFQRARMLATSFLPLAWILFSLTYSRGNYSIFIRKWTPVLLTFALLPVLCLVSWSSLFVQVGRLESGDAAFVLGLSGVIIQVGMLTGAVATLMNLERTFKASVGTMRWQIKFLILGIGLIFASRIYSGSQAVLYRSQTFSLQVVDSAALFLGCLLLLRALTRAGIFKVDVYPSEKFLQYSITGLLTGAYLLGVGVFARVVTMLGGDEAFPLKAFLILVALAILAVILLSERLRQYLREFISRNFTRPQYDYRLAWLNLTDRTASILDAEQLALAFANFISETLHVLSVTIWIWDEKLGQLRLVASTCFTETNSSGITADEQTELMAHLQSRAQPFIVEEMKGDWAETLKAYYADYFKKGGSRVCVPLIARAKSLGMITLGDRVNAARYGTEELDLLKCVGDQFASNLLNLQLSSQLVHARELEAFQTISAFFVHDLKNTASTLNLMLQNFRVHYDNPEFREDALRAISKTTNHIGDLIRRLSLFRQRLELNPQTVDLNEVVKTATECLVGKPGLTIDSQYEPLPKLNLDPEQINKVVTNLLLNAAEAMSGQGEVRLQTCQQNGWAVISVSDHGCGMSPEYLRQSLFRPFQSTKKGGLGIGMFHTKMIVEAHRGKIEVKSEQGAGTSFRVLLPVHN